MKRILFVGEQVNSCNMEIKGFDYFFVNNYKEDGVALYSALTEAGLQVDWLKTNLVPKYFPETYKELSEYDVIILSDVGSNSLLLHPEMLTNSIARPNRLKLLKEYVEHGGGLIMIGGWMSFAGIDGKAKYHGTLAEEILPVTCFPHDDRIECPEGIVPVISNPKHPILKDVDPDWPYFLGYNKVKVKEKAEAILSFNNDPLLCVWEYGKGKTAAFTSDCAPHWGSQKFINWSDYNKFWINVINWLSRNN